MTPRIFQHARTILLLAAALLFASLSYAAEPAGRACWPEFHGPNRDNISPDTGLLNYSSWKESIDRCITNQRGRRTGASVSQPPVGRPAITRDADITRLRS
jgi:hypothetical protein